MLMSENNEFNSVFQQKFDGFKQGATHEFDSRKISIEFSSQHHVFSTPKKLSSHTWQGDGVLKIKHEYLTTACDVFIFYDSSHNITKLLFYYSETVIFKALNFLASKKLRRQLFQIIIKHYIEQTLLWQLCTQHDLRAIHAAAIEQKGSVTVLAGMNGIGKSTKALQQVKTDGALLFADNYLLVDKKNAYFSPDVVRLDQWSMQLLSLNEQNEFGFGKKTVKIPANLVSTAKRAPIKEIARITLGKNESKWKSSKQSVVNKIILDQCIHQEEVLISPVSQIKQKFDITTTSYPDCDYYDWEIERAP